MSAKKTATKKSPAKKKVTKKTSTKKAATQSATKPKAPAKPKKLSLIDAAVKVLGESKEPLNCKQIVEQVTAKKLWSTSAATPHATLYSAILREINVKGKDARFKKVDRGHFSLA